MTKLNVTWTCGRSQATEVVEVADGEEYWFEGDKLCVGQPPRYEIPAGPGHIRARAAQVRLHIFNLARVEVLT